MYVLIFSCSSLVLHESVYRVGVIVAVPMRFATREITTIEFSLYFAMFVALCRLSTSTVSSTFLVWPISKCTTHILYDLWFMALLL